MTLNFNCIAAVRNFDWVNFYVGEFSVKFSIAEGQSDANEANY